MNMAALEIRKLSPPREGGCVKQSWLASGAVGHIELGWWGIVWEVRLCPEVWPEGQWCDQVSLETGT